jgi:LuxR family transcriptional regulator, activator of tox operons
MQVLKLSDVRKSNDPLRAQLARLIAVVGTPKFESELFDVAHDALHCEHVTAFVKESNARPRVVLAANIGDTPIARPLADIYIARYWDLDPANRGVPLCHNGESVALRIAPETDINDDLYRRDCYTAPRISERLTLMQRHGEDVYRLNFYAGPRQRFAAPVVELLLKSGDLLMSLVMKNDAASEAMQPQTFTSRLRLIAPNIPPREAEVCTAIMLGMTSEAIALKLGISVNTVLTYRKRAYSRLNISCQNELMRLILV